MEGDSMDAINGQVINESEDSPALKQLALGENDIENSCDEMSPLVSTTSTNITAKVNARKKPKYMSLDI